MNSAVFLDRDGVINAAIVTPEGLDSPRSAEEFQLLPGVGRAIRALNEEGFPVVVISNQPGIAKAKFESEHLDAMTELMHARLGEDRATLTSVYYCLHHPDAVRSEYKCDCECRKPKPGMLLRASQELGLDLRASYMIGDQRRDMIAGKAAGCTTVLVGADRLPPTPEADHVCADLYSAVALIRELANITPILARR